MDTLTEVQRSDLEATTHLLRARERSLQALAQSPRCSRRAEAEQELTRVRTELAAAYHQLRAAHPNGPDGPRHLR